jgi:predicted 2-oxoglutarate/Fe(II)-dependent dioxygenase YbiX/peroxiredoxin
MEKPKTVAHPSPRLLEKGDPFPWLRQRTSTLPRFAVDSLAGRYIVLCFFGSLADPIGRSAMGVALRHRDLFDDKFACLFGISIDRDDETQKRICDLPGGGVRILWDFDESVCKACGIIPPDMAATGPKAFFRMWVIVDPTLHVLATFPFTAVPGDDPHEPVFQFLRQLRPPENYAGFEIPAPVLVLPNVFDEQLCQKLIGLYDADGGTESGVVRDSRGVIDASFKRRKDYTLVDEQLCQTIRERIHRRVVPEISKLFFMQIRRMERYIVGCYAAEDGGHFRPHRDNNPGVTQHRRFAISINLNADFEGGSVCFPEYNMRGIKAPAGWAVVFPCAILHQVHKVTAGRRYAFLPFVYDEAGARIRVSDPPNGGAARAEIASQKIS